MPKQINTPAPGSRLVRLFNLKGRFQPVLDEVIVPVVSVDAEEIEQRPATAAGSIGATAAERATSWIINPNDSGKIIRVRGLYANLGAASFLDLTYSYLWTLGVQNALNKGWADRSIPGAPVATAQIGSSTAGAATTPDYRFLLAGDYRLALKPADAPLSIVLYPGAGVQAVVNTVNLSLDVTWFWTEEDIVTQ